MIACAEMGACSPTTACSFASDRYLAMPSAAFGSFSMTSEVTPKLSASSLAGFAASHCESTSPRRAPLLRKALDNAYLSPFSSEFLGTWSLCRASGQSRLATLRGLRDGFVALQVRVGNAHERHQDGDERQRENNGSLHLISPDIPLLSHFLRAWPRAGRCYTFLLNCYCAVRSGWPNARVADG
jgi:hypothetical protein